MTTFLHLAVLLGGLWLSPGTRATTAQSELRGTGRTPPVGSIEADNATLTLLRAIEKRIGTEGARNNVRTLLISGVRSLDSGAQYPFVLRLMYPDRFRYDDVVTLAWDGKTFWRRPEFARVPLEPAKRNLMDRFLEQSLLLLLRVPAAMAVNATASAVVGANVFDISLAADGEFKRYLRVDDKGNRLAIWHLGGLDKSDRVSTVRRTLTLEEFKVIDGVSFPIRMREVIGNYPATIVYSEILINEGITREDFEPR
jgi:hypothetical protein